MTKYIPQVHLYLFSIYFIFQVSKTGRGRSRFTRTSSKTTNKDQVEDEKLLVQKFNAKEKSKEF